ncbi:MAG: hypothetical protein CMD14_04740 [Flavobacteriales bacterium]|nr:hypothetical protein [Flavobacteriales bacterium]|tara:strand:- start:12552 stop:12995 length:444 start_codon:yes stop_codon:yes gene_type:complete
MNEVKISRKRHIAKTVTWRVLGSLDTLLLAVFFTSSFKIGGWIAFTEIVTKTLLYYLHERTWYAYRWNFKTEKHKKTGNKKRHIIKTVTWRIIGTLDTLILAWIFTGDALTGVKIITAELITKMVLYYLHERAWYASNWGIVKLKKN